METRRTIAVHKTANGGARVLGEYAEGRTKHEILGESPRVEQKYRRTMRIMRAIKKRNEDIRTRFYELTRSGMSMMKAYEQVGEEFYLEARTIREIVAKRE